MSTLNIAGLTLDTDDGTVTAVLNLVQSLNQARETTLIRVPDRDGVNDIVTVIGFGIPTYGVLAAGSSSVNQPAYVRAASIRD